MSPLPERTTSDREVQDALVDVEALALTMWAEARGDWRQGNSSVEERIAVGCVVRNRLPRFAAFRALEQTYRAVCFAPKQFSCWDPIGGAANYKAVMLMAVAIVTGQLAPIPLIDECRYLAAGIVAGTILDRTNGATMYYAPAAMVPRDAVPIAARGKVTLPIGEQLFYV